MEFHVHVFVSYWCKHLAMQLCVLDVYTLLLCICYHGMYTLLWCFLYRVPWPWNPPLNHQIWQHKPGKRCIGIDFITLVQKYNVQVLVDRYNEMRMFDEVKGNKMFKYNGN